jgi:DNA-binding transcriptional LysR family regulator
MINLQWLRTFAVLAELRHFTRTAERLDLTQAAVSQHIRHLEGKYGALFIRKGRQLDITPAGQALLDYYLDMEQANNRLVLRLTETDAEHGEIKIITPGSIGLLIYPMLLAWQKQHPGLSVRHRFAPDTEVLAAILSNQYEVGILTFKPDDPRIIATPFAEDTLELVAPANHHLCDWDALMELGFIDHPDGQAMATRLFSRRFPGNSGIRSIPSKGYCNQVGLLLEPVARGLGFTVLPCHARKAFARQDQIAVMDCGVSVVDTLWLIHRAEWSLSCRASKTVAYIQAQVAQVNVSCHERL